MQRPLDFTAMMTTRFLRLVNAWRREFCSRSSIQAHRDVDGHLMHGRTLSRVNPSAIPRLFAGTAVVKKRSCFTLNKQRMETGKEVTRGSQPFNIDRRGVFPR
jgi:hypothetical protein